jgi:AcrR family transcriptional regulator
MVRSAADLIRRRGVTETSLRDVVAHAKAPRGSLQHYFPQGKDELVAEALTWMGGVAARHVRRYADELDPPRPSSLLKAMVDEWRDLFVSSGFEAGCPLVAATADVVATNEALRLTVKRAFDGWLEPLESALVEMGVPAVRSQPLALLVIGALEGAIVIARTRRDLTPLDALVQELAPVLDAAVSKSRRRRE